MTRLELGTKRECTACPPWVVRCAHWDGLTLRVDDNAIPVPGHVSYPSKFSIVGPGRAYLCSCKKHEILANGHETHADYDTLPSAEVEFTRRELELLGRVPA